MLRMAVGDWRRLRCDRPARFSALSVAQFGSETGGDPSRDEIAASGHTQAGLYCFQTRQSAHDLRRPHSGRDGPFSTPVSQTAPLPKSETPLMARLKRQKKLGRPTGRRSPFVARLGRSEVADRLNHPEAHSP
jgi:hypothetical protein